MTLPNVLFVTLDQWRADFFGAGGNKCIQTPVLDNLCHDGVLFTNHFTCIAPCGPSRTTLLTGMYPSNHRAVRNGTPLNHSLTNVALEARKLGYDPLLYGYTDTTPDPRILGEEHPAFNTYEGIMPGFEIGMSLPSHNEPWLAYLEEQGYNVPGPGYEIYFPDPEFSLPPNRHSSYVPSRFKAKDSETAWLTDCLLKDLSKSGSDPYFYHLTYLRPHPPFISPPEFHDLYQPEGMQPAIRERSLEEMRACHPFLDFAYDMIGQSDFFMQGEGICADLDAEEVKQIRATYSALITEADQNLGRIIAHLKESGIYDDTLIIVTSDHGEQLGDHYLFGKLGFYDQSFHIPLIVKPPTKWGCKTGRQVSEFTESVDLMPMILDGLGQQTPRQCNGRSLIPFLHSEKPTNWRDAVHWLYDFRDPLEQRSEGRFGVKSEDCNLLVHRDSDFKYVHFASLPPLLFDMRNDPGETTNLAEEPDYQAVVLDYAQRLLSWRMRHEYSELDSLITSDEGLVGHK
ncbi:MAG: sulfatase-like hydrolase/transferase [Proteobacteria bacterium]|nr:sulfatase-like hydrolase/transferase [Pseudomonadota bacterium]